MLVNTHFGKLWRKTFVRYPLATLSFVRALSNPIEVALLPLFRHCD